MITNNTANDAPFTNRGIKQAPFFVLYKATMPSILIEMGFISNQHDREWITNKDNQKKLAQNLANAIADYIVNVDNFPLKEKSILATQNQLSKANDETNEELIYYIQFLS